MEPSYTGDCTASNSSHNTSGSGLTTVPQLLSEKPKEPQSTQKHFLEQETAWCELHGVNHCWMCNQLTDPCQYIGCEWKWFTLIATLAFSTYSPLFLFYYTVVELLYRLYLVCLNRVLSPAEYERCSWCLQLPQADPTFKNFYIALTVSTVYVCVWTL